MVFVRCAVSELKNSCTILAARRYGFMSAKQQSGYVG